jgi:hypothetical protein
MVTNVPFYSFKDMGLKRTVPFIVIVAIALGIALIASHPPRRAVRHLLRLRPCRATWSTSSSAVEGQAGQRDRHRRPTNPTKHGPASLRPIARSRAIIAVRRHA